MSDLLQVSDLEKAKLHDTFHSEVITGKVGGLASGANIDFATNAVTGQVQATMPYILNQIGGVIAFDFATGGTLNLRREFVEDATGGIWQWTGIIPPTGYVVAPGTDPALDSTWVQIYTRSHAALSGTDLAGSHPASAIAMASGTVQDFANDQVDQYKINASNIYDVFVVYGQSNSVGYALGTPGRYPPLDGCDYWNGSAIVPLIYTMRTSQNEPSSGHAWVAFANEYTRLTGRKVLIVPCGKGGTSIADMSKGTALYTDMVTYATNAKAAVISGGYTLGTVSVLFHQGETDQLNGVTRDAYQNLFDLLSSDMRNDIPALHFFNFTVGYPQNRQEKNIQAIQTAQRYVARNKARVFTAFDGCGKFTQADGLLGTFDGVHYTQRGYNLMGTKGAQEVARVTAAFDETYDLRTTVTDCDMSIIGSLDLPSDQAWKYVAATAKIVSKAFVLQDTQTSGVSRLSNVVGIDFVGGGIRFYLSCRATKILSMSADINSTGKQQGFSVSIGGSGQFGGLYYIDVVVRQDLEFIAKGDGSILKGPTGFISSYFTNILSTSVVGSIVTITHPTSDFFGSAIGYGGSSNDKFNVVAFASPSATTKTLGFDVADTYKTAIVNIPHCKIDPLDIIFNDIEISISCIVTEFNI